MRNINNTYMYTVMIIEIRNLHLQKKRTFYTPHTLCWIVVSTYVLVYCLDVCVCVWLSTKYTVDVGISQWYIYTSSVLLF